MLRSASVKHAARRWWPVLAFALHAQVGAVKVEREAASLSSAAPALEVWMTNEASASGQTVLLLYVKSTQTFKLHASVSITKKGEAGTSLVRQQARAC